MPEDHTPWYRQRTSWAGIIMGLGSVGAYLMHEIDLQMLLTGLGSAAAFIFLRGATIKAK